MSYESIDKLQNFLAENVFSYTSSPKKAAGRALGTFIEIITFYLLKTWGLESGISIERPLQEFANKGISHNVEFTLHPSRKIKEKGFDANLNLPLRASTLFGASNEVKLAGVIVDKNRILKNACTVAECEDFIFNVCVDSCRGVAILSKLKKSPFAMFECKRVGVEEGMKKGPQTIEKAKQGSYVARTVSRLQRVRLLDGSIGGIYQKTDGTFSEIKPYYDLLLDLVDSPSKNTLDDFVLTVGVVSNHGNWFTHETQNKEMKVLAQSYDWLLFLTDKGLSAFITKLLMNPAERYSAVRACFVKKYSGDENGKNTSFTKARIDIAANIALQDFFSKNINEIETWFNVITPAGKNISDLKKFLAKLVKKEAL